MGWWLSCRVSALQYVVAGSISSGGDHGIRWWWDQIRSKQLYSVLHVAYECLSIFLLWLFHYHIYLILLLDLYISFLPSWTFPRWYVGPIWEVVVPEVIVSSWGQKYIGASRTHMVKGLHSNYDWLIWHHLNVAWPSGRVLALHAVVACSISSGGDHGIHCWWDQIRSKQQYKYVKSSGHCLKWLEMM